MIALTAISTFSLPGEQYIYSVIIIFLSFNLIALPVMTTWTGIGVVVGKYLANPKIFKIYNWILGSFCATTVVLILK